MLLKFIFPWASELNLIPLTRIGVKGFQEFVNKNTIRGFSHTFTKVLYYQGIKKENLFRNWFFKRDFSSALRLFFKKLKYLFSHLRKFVNVRFDFIMTVSLMFHATMNSLFSIA